MENNTNLAENNALISEALGLKLTLQKSIYPDKASTVKITPIIEGTAKPFICPVSAAADPKFFLKLMDYGYNIGVHNYHLVSNLLKLARQQKSTETVSTGIGPADGAFVIGPLVIRNSPKGVTVETVAYDPTSTPFDLTPTGKLKDAISGIKEHVLNRPQIELMLIFALSSFVGSHIDLPEIANPIMSIHSPTSRGKSTLAQIAEFVYGKRLIETHNITHAKFTKMLSGCAIVPFEYEDFDESKRFTKKDKIALILELYSAPKTTAKRLLTPIIITSGESIIHTQTKNGNNGQLSRVLEINSQNSFLTESAAHSRQLKRLAQTQCGQIAPAFAKSFYRNRMDSAITEKYCKELDKIAEDFEFNSAAARLSNQIALYMLTADFFNAAFEKQEMTINKKNLYNYLLSQIKSQLELTNAVSSAYMALCAFIQANRTKFHPSMPSPQSPYLETDPTSAHCGYRCREYTYIDSRIFNNSELSVLKKALIKEGVIEKESPSRSAVYRYLHVKTADGSSGLKKRYFFKIKTFR